MKKIKTFVIYLSIASLTSGLFSTMLKAANAKQPSSTLVTLNPHMIANQFDRIDIAKNLGWKKNHLAFCGGYYFEPPFTYADSMVKKNLFVITSNEPLFALHGTSYLPLVTINRQGQQITADKAYIYRDKKTDKLSVIDLYGKVNLREPRTLVIADKMHLDLKTKQENLEGIIYRTAVYSSGTAPVFNNAQLQKSRNVYHLTAWGKATEFVQEHPRIYELKNASYSTCPPLTNVWRVQASDIQLNKLTGRGTAKNARLYIKNVPIFYTPYFNFPIDNRRKTGLLFPFAGRTTRSGAQITAPFYWNIAPNYDDLITPTIFAKRGLETTNLFRYLTPLSGGQTTLNILPNDRAFATFQKKSLATFASSSDPVTLANLNRLENSTTTRGALRWEHAQHFNDHWSTNVNYNYVTDDYYLSDLRNNLDEVTENQLLQQADVTYQNQHWSFIGRVQAYQTLHPVDVDVAAQFKNQYSRLPQLILNGDYPNQAHGFNYFINNEITRFDIQRTPGTTVLFPKGDRIHTQPGVSYPLTGTAFYLTPRLQAALSKYQLRQLPPNAPSSINRAIPIFDVSAGVFFDKELRFFGRNIRQTLEPQLNYTYIPYKNQESIPDFDTIYTTLTYDQLFSYNRFSGLDRIGDTNQLSVGAATRLIDADTGFERARFGLGQILYFKKRLVTLCSIYDSTCVDEPSKYNNNQLKSPIAGIIDYHLNDAWRLSGNTIWNFQKNQLENQIITLQYSPDPTKIINLGYNFVRNGDIQPNLPANSQRNNLKQTDVSFAWPVYQRWSMVGRLTRSINEGHFQNMLTGLQYDSCCWAVRFVAGRTFVKLAPPNGSPQYNNEFYAQFALKGLGNIGSDPTQLLGSSIPGYNPNFGHDY